MISYQLCPPTLGRTETTIVQRLTDKSFIPFDTANIDYQKFKSDLTSGAELQDTNGTVMTTDQVTAFLGTLK